MTSAVESEIRALQAKVEQADVVADPDLLDSLLVEGFTFTSQDGTTYTKEQVLQAHQPAGLRKFTRFETSDLQVRAFENAAVVTVRVDLATKTAQAVLQFTRFWLKIDGRWRIVGGTAVRLEHSH